MLLVGASGPGKSIMARLLARPDATDASLMGSLSAVGLAVVDLPTELDATADHLQVQQIALARVLLADPAMVILDEVAA